MIGVIMQKESLNYIEQDKFYSLLKRTFEVLISIIMILISKFIFVFLFIRKLICKREIFIKKEFFLNESKTIHLTFFNCENILIRSIPLFYHVLLSNISFIGVALVRYKSNIKYQVNHKPGIFSLWFIRRNTKMQNCTISSCNKEYIENKCILTDIKIFFKSFVSLLYFTSNKKYSKQVKIFDISFDNLKIKDILELIQVSIENNIKRRIYFINADCLNKTFENKEYKDILNNKDLLLADGSGVNMACNILKTPLIENLNGTDMLPLICNLSCSKKYKIFLLGAKEGVANKMKEKLELKYPNIQIVGTQHGFLDDESSCIKVLNKINKLQTDILFVAMGAPFQEIFIEKYKNVISAKITLGVGGLFDFYSTNTNRAPLYIRELGFEWIYRMIQEPKRMWKRYILGNPLFLYRVFKYKKVEEKNSLINIYLNNYDKPNRYKMNKSLWKWQFILRNKIKRLIDIFASIILMICLSPLLITIMMIIKITSKGNIFFIQKRVGISGTLFNMYKFRSMVVDAEELKAKLMDQNQSADGVLFKMSDDPRITKVGRFIRKTSIDELPQLLNVLKGEMSLVGPRPPIIEEVKQYNMDDKKRLDVKPGITCIWQVSGRSKIPFKEQVKMDKEYIKNQSIYKDIVLLLKTIPAVLFQKGSY
jgi:exopolysaccharide biosynthesis WecB/TagA/CpsF family protein